MTATTSTASSPLVVFLDSARLRIDAALSAYLPRSDQPESCPPRLAEAMRYSVLGPGKRLRPTLALMAAEACGGDSEAVLPAACALELVHTYSLIHDDLPAMDDDDLRRGRPTAHRAFDEATAILAGDSLLALAFELILAHTQPPAAAIACALALAEASGPRGMVGGQMADLLAEHQPDPTIEALEAIHRRKTGALLRASLRMGGAVALAPPAIIHALDDYGDAIGLAFQIVDDLLDVEGDESKMGKRVRKDSQLGKWTYPALLGIAGSRDRARELAQAAVAAVAPLGDRANLLRELAWNLLERDR
jgi:geranylgeranyl diphosphate synthase type II